MKNIALHGLLAALCFASSCATHKEFVFAEGSTLRTDNTIYVQGRAVLKVSPMVTRLGERKLVTEKGRMSLELTKHLIAVLAESNSLQDELLAASPNIIVVRKTRESKSLQPRYLYQYDFEKDDWICLDLSQEAALMPIETSAVPTFYRSVYIVKNRNRVVLKDSFGDISIIYVIQGKHSKAPYPITRMWSPANFATFITTSNYITDRINPITYAIAKDHYLFIRPR